MISLYFLKKIRQPFYVAKEMGEERVVIFLETILGSSYSDSLLGWSDLEKLEDHPLP